MIALLLAMQWIVPEKPEAEPVWGIQGGISFGLWPTGGPKGLFRIYTPYLGQPRLRMINYVAVEPVVKGKRGYSELEERTMTATECKVEKGELRVRVALDEFQNGAKPVIEVRIHKDRPFEISFRVHGEKMDSCILTATMGNYARLRYLWLAGEVVDSRKLWPDAKLDGWGFAPHQEWKAEKMLASKKDVIVAATPDEEKAVYDKSVPEWWRYEGKPGTQYWRTAARKDLVVRVNARKTYWGDQGPIPGGLSYENFELEAPFEDGQEFVFGVIADPPRKLGFRK